MSECRLVTLHKKNLLPGSAYDNKHSTLSWFHLLKQNLENVYVTETVYSPGTDTGDQYTLNPNAYFSNVNVYFHQVVEYVTFRGLIL